MNTEAAWAAGFFDGEGCTTINKSRPKERALDKARPQLGLRMSLAQVQIEPLIRFRDAVGVGAIRGPYLYSTNRQPHWQWNVSNMDVIKVLDIIWPYLSVVKQRQALIKVYEYARYLEDYPPRSNQYDKRIKKT